MCARQKHKGGKAKGLGMSHVQEGHAPIAQKLTIAPKGLSKTIRLELSSKKHEKVGNTSTVILGDAGASIALQDFNTASPQAGLTGLDRDMPFELLTGVLQDKSSLVTLPIDSGTNNSEIAASA